MATAPTRQYTPQSPLFAFSRVATFIGCALRRRLSTRISRHAAPAGLKPASRNSLRLKPLPGRQSPREFFTRGRSPFSAKGVSGEASGSSRGGSTLPATIAAVSSCAGAGPSVVSPPFISRVSGSDAESSGTLSATSGAVSPSSRGGSASSGDSSARGEANTSISRPYSRCASTSQGGSGSSGESSGSKAADTSATT